MLFLDQANDYADTKGAFICDSFTSTVNPSQPCTVQDGSPTNADGRSLNNVTHSQKQVVIVQSVSGSGAGPYTVTISPGVYFNNIRTHPEYTGANGNYYPGAYWIGFVQNDGLENLSVEDSSNAGAGIVMDECYQCWAKNIRSINAARAHINFYQTMNDVVRDSYFYQNQTHSSGVYGIEIESSSQILIENNIIQQTTVPVMVGQTTGSVVGYNFSIDSSYDGGGSSPTFAIASFPGHNAGNAMNLWEGNNTMGVNTDDTWGSAYAITLFRNMFLGWQSGKTHGTVAIASRAFTRAMNAVGNILGRPGYHNTYEAYATSTTGGVNGGAADTSIYSLGFTGVGGDGTCAGPPICDALIRPTTMRWGNYDTITNGTKWDSTEASPAAVPYVNANFTATYFGSLAHTLPTSLYYTSKPSWWPAATAWPPIGPDVSTGNVGTCSGTYSGAQGTSPSQCTGGTLSTAWDSHVTSIPAQDCFLNTMGGPPDGTGNVLNFDASLCYASSQSSPAPPSSVVPPTNLVTKVQ
jgi:hypothetical protein